jgi:hypothetical protein
MLGFIVCSKGAIGLDTVHPFVGHFKAVLGLNAVHHTSVGHFRGVWILRYSFAPVPMEGCRLDICDKLQGNSATHLINKGFSGAGECSCVTRETLMETWLGPAASLKRRRLS